MIWISTFLLCLLTINSIFVMDDAHGTSTRGPYKRYLKSDLELNIPSSTVYSRHLAKRIRLDSETVSK